MLTKGQFLQSVLIPTTVQSTHQKLSHKPIAEKVQYSHTPSLRENHFDPSKSNLSISFCYKVFLTHYGSHRCGGPTDIRFLPTPSETTTTPSVDTQTNIHRFLTTFLPLDCQCSSKLLRSSQL